MRFVVLGGTGTMGKIAVRDLVERTRKEKAQIIIAARHGKEAKKFTASFKQRRVTGRGVDASNIPQLVKLLKRTDVAVNCAQYYVNLTVMQACLKAKCHYLDLGGLFHTTKKQLKLHRKFKQKNLTALLGCGSTPGITNVLAAYGAQFFDLVKQIHVRFAGKDFTKYHIPFVLPYSIYTLTEEFSLSPALFTKGKLKFVDPVSLQEPEIFPKPVGKVTCFATLHSEVATFPSSFPGLKECSFKLAFDEQFVHDMKTMLQLGLLSKEEVDIGGKKIRPIDVAAMQMHKFASDPKAKIKDTEFIRVRMHGKKYGKPKTVILDCQSFSKNKWNAAAGDVDTGVPPSILAQMIAKGLIRRRGVFPPEIAVPPELFFQELQKRGMKILINGKSRCY